MEDLKPYRDEIDAIDDQIIELLARRMAVVHAVAHLKKQRGIPAILPDRVAEVADRNAAHATALGMDESYARALYALIINHACETEQALMDGA